MPSKRSFCNTTLLKKNLSRFWPLWGGAALVGFLIPLWMFLNLGRYGAVHLSQEDFAYTIYQVVAVIVPGLTFGYAILCAMMVWSYLYSARSVGLMHSLPIDRTCLFVTNTLSGLAMMLIPYVTTGILVCLIALGWGFLDIGAALEAAVVIILITLTFFGMATFCAMVTGNIFALPVFYVILNFVFPTLEALINSFSQMFLVGVTGVYDGKLEVLSPLMRLYSKLNAGNYSDEPARLVGASTAAVYGLVGIVLLILSWVLYRMRRSESAGDVVAFRWLRPIFRYGVALASALTLGWLLYEIIWYPIFQTGYYADFVPMAVCMAVTGVIGYYVASMLLEKSLRVFRRSWPGVLTVCAGVVILCGCVRFDLLGMESRVPRQEDIARVTVSVAGQDITVTAAQPGYVNQVLEIHRSIVENADALREADRHYEAGDRLGTEYLNLRYYGPKGDVLLYRSYRLPVTEKGLETSGTYEYMLQQFLTDPDVRLSQVEFSSDSEIVDITLSDYLTGEEYVCEPVNFESIYEAYLQDAREGNLSEYNGLVYDEHESYTYPGDLRIQAVTRREMAVDSETGVGTSGGEYRYVELSPRMTHTIEALQKAGLLTNEMLAAWNEDYDAAVPATVQRG